MALYKVNFYYEERGYVTVEATSPELAETQVYQWLSDDGIDGLGDYIYTDREYDVTGAEVIEED